MDKRTPTRQTPTKQTPNRQAHDRRAPKRKAVRKKSKAPLIIIVIILIALIAVAMVLMEKYTPTKERADLSDYFGITSPEEVVIIRNHAIMDQRARDINGHLYVSYPMVHDTLNDRFYVDQEGLLLYAKDQSEILVNIAEQTSSYTENFYENGEVTQTEVPFVCAPAGLIDGELYLSLEFVQQFTPFDFSYYEEPSRIVLTTDYGTVKEAAATKDTALREKGGIKSPILKDLTAGEQVQILGEEENWYKAFSADGITGYVEKKSMGEPTDVVLTSSFQEETFTHILHDGIVNMVWHQVTNMDANGKLSEVLADTKGVNVISPTWFYLEDTQGGIHDLASKDYVETCHAKGIQVWGLVSNLESTDLDDEAFLYQRSLRQNFINHLMEKAQEYNLDGINLDFESMSQEVGESYVQLVRELSLACGNHGLILSVDHYVPTEYTAHYDREEQADFADYIVIMGYDEHYAGSGEGSVASLPFVEKGVQDTIAYQVPPEQIILGMPFYTRMWVETPKSGASDLEMASDDYVPYELVSKALGMIDQDSLIAQKQPPVVWLEELGQNYAEWPEDGTICKIWMEDEQSLELKLQLVQKYQLGGGAFWKITLEDPSVWDVIQQYLG
ncbi:MAG: SH3 domain-containing protein [Lachnospiraceae bacterium]|nr:SH3 domain-containing protein [Lachnospiraceae bacterium]